MRTKREVQLTLLSELHDICEKNNLHYVLYGETARNAYLYGTMDNAPGSFAIAMTQGEAEKLHEYLLANPKEGRGVESLKTNPRFNKKYFAYADTNTTEIHMIGSNYNKLKAIHIKIYFIQKYETKDLKIVNAYGRKQKLVDLIWGATNLRVRSWSPVALATRIAVTILNLFVVIMGRKRMAKKYYMYFRKISFIDKWEDIQNYNQVKIQNHRANAIDFQKVKKVKLGDKEFYIPEDHNDYFIGLNGENWMEEPIQGTKRTWKAVVDANIPCEESIQRLQEAKLMDAARINYEKVRIKNIFLRSTNKKVSRLWNLVLMTKDQVGFNREYRNNMDSLKKFDLSKEADLNTLSERLEPITDSIKKYANKKMTYILNDELQTIVDKIIVYNEGEKYYNEICKLRKKEKFV